MITINIHIFISLLILCATAGSLIFWSSVTVLNQGKLRRKELELENLTFDDVCTVIDCIVKEVIDKHFLNYRLRDIRIIPDMSDDVNTITKEIYESFSRTFIRQAMKFYSKEYFIRLITRRVEIYLVQYTDQYKPTTK